MSGGEALTQHVPKTVTAARLLADQGHVESARQVLGAVLARSPGDVEAARLVTLLETRRDGASRSEPPEEVLAQPVPADPASIAATFRVALARSARPRSGDAAAARLRAFLDRIRRNRREAPR
jgi:hypothetical protein